VLGTLVNTGAIIAGGLVGLALRRGIPQAFRLTLIQSLGLAVCLIGLRSALSGTGADLLLTILSLAIGGLAGQALRIEERLTLFGEWLETRWSAGGHGIARGFVTASLAFCVGSMAIVGSIESGLTGSHDTLLAKAILDGVVSVVFASTLGVGVLFAAAAVLLYQGSLTLAATLLRPLLTPEVITQMSSIGGLLILAIGLNMLEIGKLRVGNMLPAIVVPFAYAMLRHLN
jgi:hypothetical protein